MILAPLRGRGFLAGGGGEAKVLDSRRRDVPLGEVAHGRLHVLLGPSGFVSAIEAVLDEGNNVVMDHTLVHLGKGVTS